MGNFQVPPPMPPQAGGQLGLLQALQNHPQMQGLMQLLQWVQQARQMADQNMVGRNLTPPMGSAMALSMGMPQRIPQPGTANATAPQLGQSLGETGLTFPQSAVNLHMKTAPELPNQGIEPVPAVKAADGMKGDAAEALINQLLGIR